jgi:hypothetical protein
MKTIAAIIALAAGGCTTLSVDFATDYGHVNLKTDGQQLSIGYSK